MHEIWNVVTYRKKRAQLLGILKKGLDLHCHFSVYEKNPLASIFKWLVSWERNLPRPKFFFENLPSSSTLSYTITKKQRRVNLQCKSHWGSSSFWGSSFIAMCLVFTVIMVLFRFRIDRILFMVLSDKVSVESSEIGSSSLGPAVIDSSLHQYSFPTCRYFFIKSCYYFFMKYRYFAFIIILKNN